MLLVGNYTNDGQESMRRFAELLMLHLPDRGIQTEHLCPKSVFGRLRPSSGGLGKWLGYMDKFLLFPRELQRRLRHLGGKTVVHICDHSNAIYTRVLRDRPHLVTCHDLLAVRAAVGEFPCCRVRASGRLYQRMILRGLNAARKVACVSAATRRDLRRITSLGPDQINTVYNGLNYPYAPLPGPEIGERIRAIAAHGTLGATAKFDQGFILHVGGNQWYKNRLGVVQIYARVCETMSQPPGLVMVGKPFTAALRRSIEAFKLGDQVTELNSVSNEDLRALYSGAGLLLFPSFEEGFGWPIIEAQACGCPVVISNQEPMAEIGGAPAVHFQMESTLSSEGAVMPKRAVDDAARAVVETLSESPQARLSRRKNGVSNAARFSTNRMVEGYIHLYQQILDTGGEPRRRDASCVSTSQKAI